jgi:hypothetical protein
VTEGIRDRTGGAAVPEHGSCAVVRAEALWPALARGVSLVLDSVQGGAMPDEDPLEDVLASEPRVDEESMEGRKPRSGPGIDTGSGGGGLGYEWIGHRQIRTWRAIERPDS